jgi:hypothetical protein
MPDFSDEQSPLVVDNVPGVRTAQLCSAECVHDAAGIRLRTDVAQSLSAASGEHPHGTSPYIIRHWGGRLPPDFVNWWVGTMPFEIGANRYAQARRGGLLAG